MSNVSLLGYIKELKCSKSKSKEKDIINKILNSPASFEVASLFFLIKAHTLSIIMRL